MAGNSGEAGRLVGGAVIEGDSSTAIGAFGITGEWSILAVSLFANLRTRAAFAVIHVSRYLTSLSPCDVLVGSHGSR